MKFRFKAPKPGENIGSHQGMGHSGKEKNYKVGEVIESDEPLDILFQNKFDRVEEPPPPPPAPTPISVPVKETLEKENPLGTDVSEDFVDDDENSKLLVFKTKDKKYNIAEKSHPDMAVNETPLSKKDMLALLKSME